ncbi:uncharacterized protein F5147DRAFT_836815 [Suillus discolor]|uniref:Protein kinase domain-containing protein n=1 Tax=Suillus discolor TaxID=1912936 RepID=A0A9P7F842_9AGAM|nr:uncharacterized protein F5147DRAFT_836815 [Suillus discolor]KAG2108948.1 hypothetical protein F5147DRAFT_836815 [Suillus discolor]
MCAALIRKAFTPFTKCQVLLLKIEDVPVGAGLPNLLIAKIFDPRFNYERKNTCKRRSYIPWSAAKEKAAADRRAFAPGDDFSIPQWERVLGSLVVGRNLLSRLGHLQGSTIPQLYASGRVALGHGENPATIQDPHSAPSSAYQELVKAVSTLASFGVIYADMRPDNIVVSSSHPRRVVLIDFGLCQFRTNEDSDDDWQEIVLCEGSSSSIRKSWAFLAPRMIRIMLWRK